MLLYLHMTYLLLLLLHRKFQNFLINLLPQKRQIVYHKPALRRKVRALLQARSATYEACADAVIQTDGRTADELLAALLSLPCLSAGI